MISLNGKPVFPPKETQFDQTTERKGRAYEESKVINGLLHPVLPPFTAGRNSAKESLGILARALQHIKDNMIEDYSSIDEAIAQVKERGDWPLPEEDQ
jgi:hypothetical protein